MQYSGLYVNFENLLTFKEITAIKMSQAQLYEIIKIIFKNDYNAIILS